MGNINLGQVFTRRIVADYMVSLFTLPSKSAVLDPCFGEGVFLHSLAENTNYFYVGYEIDPELFHLATSLFDNATLYNSDFLQCDNPTQYDGIIMNPPYIRHEKIDDLAVFGVSKQKLQEQPVFAPVPKSANLYMYFIIKAIDLLKPKGELIVIFPDSWLNSRRGASFRAILSQKCSVEKKIHVGGHVFEKDALVDVVILKLRKNTSIEDCEVLHVNVSERCISKQTDAHTAPTRTCLPKLISAVNTSAANLKQSNKMVPYSNYASIRRGITTGCNEFFINPTAQNLEDIYLQDIISTPKAVEGYCTKTATCDKLLAISREIKISESAMAYLQKWERKITDIQQPKTLAAKIQRGNKWYALNIPDCYGILFGYIVRNDMRFILNKTGKIARDNFYVITPKIDIYVLLALLNNFYTYIQLELAGRSYGGGMLKLQKYDVEGIMLPNISLFSPSDITQLGKLGQQLAEGGKSATINEISLLLSKYHETDIEPALLQYKKLRLARLGVKDE